MGLTDSVTHTINKMGKPDTVYNSLNEFETPYRWCGGKLICKETILIMIIILLKTHMLLRNMYLTQL